MGKYITKSIDTRGDFTDVGIITRLTCKRGETLYKLVKALGNVGVRCILGNDTLYDMWYGNQMKGWVPYITVWSDSDITVSNVPKDMVEFNGVVNVKASMVDDIANDVYELICKY